MKQLMSSESENPIEDIPFPKQRKLYKRHLRGAFVRSGLSMIMWIFALLSFLKGAIGKFHFIGISTSVSYIVLINPPLLMCLKYIKTIRSYDLFSLFINQLEIIGYTAIIYFCGGIDATYLTLMYASIISYVGIVAPKRHSYIVASMCVIAFGLMVGLVNLGILPYINIFDRGAIALIDQIIISSVVFGFLYVIAFISGTTANLLRVQKDKLNEKNKEFIESNKNLEQQIKERRRSEKRHRNLIEAVGRSGQAIVIIQDVNQAEAYCVFSNDIASHITGYSREDLLQKSWLDIVSPLYRDAERDRYRRSISRELIGDASEIEITSKSGEVVPIESTSIGMEYEGNSSLMVLFRDIRERKKAEEVIRESEEKLIRSKKMESLGLLAGGVAHDLNNVLSGIVSYPEILLMDLPKDSKLRKPIETMQESGHRAAAIVQDLLTVARGVAITKEVVNLNDLIGDYLNSPEFEKIKQFHPAVTINTNLDTELMNISASHVHIRKVVMNLVSNASEAIDGTGNVNISTTNRYMDKALLGYEDVTIGEYAVLSVSDDGSGIPSNDLKRIFEPFYTKKVMGRSGTGLGLAVVWNILQDHQGYIDVATSEHGTTFDLYFPITRNELSKKNLSIPIEDYKGGGEKILVVDDIENHLEISCHMLNKLGYRTHAVSSGEEAVEYLKSNGRVDLVILDMIMDPGMDGLDTYKKIIEIHPGQKAIVTSGFSKTDRVKEAQRLGANLYLKKPYTLEKIGLAVRNELNN
jgi:PAS domain S-box-containing protein